MGQLWTPQPDVSPIACFGPAALTSAYQRTAAVPVYGYSWVYFFVNVTAPGSGPISRLDVQFDGRPAATAPWAPVLLEQNDAVTLGVVNVAAYTVLDADAAALFAASPFAAFDRAYGMQVLENFQLSMRIKAGVGTATGSNVSIAYFRL